MSGFLFSHEFILASESLLQFEAQIPKRLHPIKEGQSENEFPFVQGDGGLSENHHLDEEAEYP